MNMLGHTFFLFRDADTDEIHAVYRRKDGSYRCPSGAQT